MRKKKKAPKLKNKRKKSKSHHKPQPRHILRQTTTIKDRGKGFVWSQRDGVTGEKANGNPLSRKNLTKYEMDAIMGNYEADVNVEREKEASE